MILRIMQIWGGVNSLTIKNLAFRFAGRSQLLKSVSLEINKGEMVALLGEVGSGKSILLQILQKFNEIEGGEILINNSIHLKDIPANEWRNTIGVVQQDVKIFNGTLVDNILLGNIMEEGDKVVEFCQKLGFDKYFASMPQNYLTIVGEEGINLSGGQKQLIALARALYRTPKILLLDEATSAMDSQTELFVLELLDKLKTDMGILMVTHRNSIAKRANSVYQLETGISKMVNQYEISEV